MDVKDFVAETLKQIELAINEASHDSMQYEIDNHTSKGVHFNLAVTNIESTKLTKSKAGGLKIKVVSAEGGKADEKTTTAESISRIEFNIKGFTPANSSGVVRPRSPQVQL